MKRWWYAVPCLLSISNVTECSALKRIHADAALEAGAGELAEPPLHLVLHHQVFR